MEEAMSGAERIVFGTDLVSIGMFRCPPDHAAFPGGLVDDWLIVFPRTAVRIERAEAPPIVADPTVAVLYDPPSPYRRYLVDPRGDLCDYFAVDSSITEELSSVVGADVTQRFREGHRRAESTVYLSQRRLFDLAVGEDADPVAIEEGVLGMALAVLSAGGEAEAPAPHRAATRARHRDLALDTAEFLGSSFTQPLRLSEIALQVGSAPHHLTRIFKRYTGMSIHERITELRLKRALEILGDGDSDLARLAIDLGFSSHSHFSRAFKTAFGLSPSRYRTEQPKPRTIVQAVAS
jgi:AraC-like DNA-binding protein